MPVKADKDGAKEVTIVQGKRSPRWLLVSDLAKGKMEDMGEKESKKPDGGKRVSP